MSQSKFSGIEITGIKTVIPKDFVSIDDELEFFDGKAKKLVRAKNIVGFGERHIADKSTTVLDMAIQAARSLLKEISVDTSDIELLIFVNQKNDFPEPNDASIAHGLLTLRTDVPAIHLNMGCSGYVYALWLASSLLSSNNFKNCLLLSGDLCARTTSINNRKLAPVFGDAASATLLKKNEDKKLDSYFVLGADGRKWNKIVKPFGGTRIPFDTQNIELKIQDPRWGEWKSCEGILKGEDIFNFSVDCAPAIISEVLTLSGMTKDDISLFAIHQANKQIVETIAKKAALDISKVPTKSFSKYGNTSTNSIPTLISDLKGSSFKKVLLCSFGVGLSWGAAILDLDKLHNGGIEYYKGKSELGPACQSDYWINFLKE